MVFRAPLLMQFIGAVATLVFVGFPAYLVLDPHHLQAPGVYLLSIIGLILLVFDGALFYFAFWEKWYSSLRFTDNSIILSCPLKRTLVLTVDECRFFGVQLEESYNGLPYPFIYISKHPYPRELEGKINKIRCSNEFVKFWYSDDLCNYLIAKFPNNRTGPLQYYQYQSQRNK